MVCRTWCEVHIFATLSSVLTLDNCWTQPYTLALLSYCISPVSFVRFTRIVTLLHHCFNCYIVALLLQSICVTDAATTAVGKLLVQKPPCSNCLCKLVQNFPSSNLCQVCTWECLVKLAISQKFVSRCKLQFVIIPCPSMFLSWHTASRFCHSFASDFESGCK